MKLTLKLRSPTYDRLYIVTTDGSLACIDATEAAIQAAQAGTLPQTVNIKAPTNIPAAIAITINHNDKISSIHEYKSQDEGKKLLT